MLASVSGDGKALQIEGTACTKRLMPKRASFGKKKKRVDKNEFGKGGQRRRGHESTSKPCKILNREGKRSELHFKSSL